MRVSGTLRLDGTNLTLKQGDASGSTTIYHGGPLTAIDVTLPDITTTIVGRNTTDTLTNKTFDVDGTGNSLSNVANANIKSAAGIEYSKLSLTGSILNADINASAAIAYSKLALTGTIVNADVNASAAIAYSKLSLTGAIVDTDVNASAAIAYSKLNLSTSIVNADISTSAAIAYSKLNLSDGIVNADVNSAAAIAYSKLSLTGGVVNADVSASAAIAYSKLALSGGVVDADINASAAIAYSKLALTGAIVNADLASGIDSVKIADGSVSNTEFQYLDGVTSAIQTQLNAKIATTDAVALAGAQTITGKKTLDTELTIKELASKPSPAPSAGYKAIYAKNDGKVYTLNSDDEEVEVGSGAGGGSKNYVDNPDFETNIADWTTSDPDELALSHETASPLAGSGSLKITRGTDPAGVVTGTIAAIDEADVGTLIAAEAVVKVTGADIETGQYTIEIHDGTDPVPGTVTDLQEGKHRYTFDFIPATGVTYSVVIRDDDGDDDDVLLVDEVRVGPNPAIIGAVVTDWQAYTPSVQGLGTVTSITTEWRQVGSDIEIRGGFTTATPNTDEIRISLPSGFTTGGVASGTQIVGLIASNANQGSTYRTLASSGLTYIMVGRFADGSTLNPLTAVIGTVFAGSTRISFTASIPVNLSGTVAMLTPSVLGENARVRYILASNQAIVDTNNVLYVNEDTTTFETQGSWSSASGVITIPTDGMYSINPQAFATTDYSILTILDLYVKRGSAAESLERRIDSRTTGRAVGKPVEIKLAAGDLIRVRYSGASRTLEAVSQNNFIEITRIADRSSRGALGFGLATSDAAGLVAGVSRGLVEMHTGNGHGSSSTTIRRFTTTQTNTGTAITVSGSSTIGTVFTINEDGIYSIYYCDGDTGSASLIGLSKNSNQLTTNVASITVAHRLGQSGTASNTIGNISFVGKLVAGDVIRPHTNGTPNFTNDRVQFRIEQLMKL